ncbi:hypothetical protein JCM10908_005767 [Rhodotorula pacifica]|uniref:uncharacterized protein n=1 Tax=Rhodotorula pacifica TaxID=1495444 RepID=UPI0031721F6B
MGLTDLFTNATNAFVPPPVPPKSEADLDRSKDEIIRRLTEELVQTRQRNAELERRDLNAKQADQVWKGAEARVRELEDVLALKNGMFDALERQIVLLEKYTADLQRKEAELVALRAEQAEQPISASDVAHRFEQLSELFTQLQDTLTCPVCYEPFGRGQAVSLQCGHTFCQTCYTEWEQRHVEAFKMSPQQGVYSGPECPECRTADVRRGRVRIYSLEEVVRLVERGKREIAAHPYTPQIKQTVQPVTGSGLLLQEQGVAEEEPDGSAGASLPASSEVAQPEPAVVDAVEQVAFALDERENGVSDAAFADPMVASAPMESLTVGTLLDETVVAPDSAQSGLVARPETSTDELPVPVQPMETDQAPAPSHPPVPAVLTPPPTSPSPTIPDASRLSLEETYLRERAAARARAREEELRLEAEMAARRAEKEEREAREAREQVLLERGRRPYAVGGGGGAVREAA